MAPVGIVNMNNILCRPSGGLLPRAIRVCVLFLLMAAAPVAAQTDAHAPADAAELLDPARSLPPLLNTQTSSGTNLDSVSSTSTTEAANQTPASSDASPASAATEGERDENQTDAQQATGNVEKLSLNASERKTGEGSSGNLPGGGFWTILPSLLLVLALLAGCVWAARKYLPGAGRLGGNPAMKVIGRTQISPRQSLLLVKIGRRLLVVGATADRLARIDNITDPTEVSEIIGLVESARPGSATAGFRNALKQADDEFGQLDDIDDDEPVDMVSLSPQARSVGNAPAAPAAPAAPSGPAGLAEQGNEDVGRIRSELDNLRRKVREAMGRGE